MRAHVLGVVLALGALGGCAPADQRPVAVLASVTVDQARVPFGSPVELRYVFERSAEAVSLEGPYRVFVHFTDPEGALLWGDDHDPPSPVESWAPGAPVTWTRGFFLPEVPYLGPVEVRVGLFNPTTGARLRLAGDAVEEDAYRLATFEVTPQTHPLEFAAGWHQAETTGGGRPEQWRWTSGTGTLTFVTPETDVVLQLVVDHTVALAEPQTVEVRLGDRVLDTLALPPGERVSRRIALPAEAYGDSAVQTISLVPNQTFVPADRDPASPDDRVLGVRVFHALLLDEQADPARGAGRGGELVVPQALIARVGPDGTEVPDDLLAALPVARALREPSAVPEQYRGLIAELRGAPAP